MAQQADGALREILTSMQRIAQEMPRMVCALQATSEIVQVEVATTAQVVERSAQVAGAVEEVAGTIRHRIAVRRELRALSAQGRISGSILGALPIAFFLVLAVTSHQELAPVYRSPAGIAMISSGLVMEALAFVWIRRLLRVEA
jgi:tight adherence protein B